MSDIDYEKLNPGIRKTVQWLRANGFRTTDSGDGKTKEFECDRGMPYVCILVEPERMFTDTMRLNKLLEEKGLTPIPMNQDCSGGPFLQVNFDPSLYGQDGAAILDLMYVDDKLLFGGDDNNEIKENY